MLDAAPAAPNEGRRRPRARAKDDNAAAAGKAWSEEEGGKKTKPRKQSGCLNLYLWRRRRMYVLYVCLQDRNRTPTIKANGRKAAAVAAAAAATAAAIGPLA